MFVCVQTLISQEWILQKIKNLEPSEGSALAMEQGPRTVAPLEGKPHLVKVSNCHRIFTDSIGLLVTLVSVSEASAVWDEPDL